MLDIQSNCSALDEAKASFPFLYSWLLKILLPCRSKQTLYESSKAFDLTASFHTSCLGSHEGI